MIIIATWGYPRVPSWPGWHRERSWGSLEEQPHTPGLTGFLLFSTVFFIDLKLSFCILMCIELSVLFWILFSFDPSWMEILSIVCKTKDAHWMQYQYQPHGCPLDVISIPIPRLPIGCNTNTKIAHFCQYEYQGCPLDAIPIPFLNCW